MENERRDDSPSPGNTPGQQPQGYPPQQGAPQGPYPPSPGGYPPSQGYPNQGGAPYPNQPGCPPPQYGPPPQGYPPQNYHPQYGSQYAQPTFCGANNLCGVRGWLLFLCIYLTIITPFFTFVLLAVSHKDVERVSARFPAFGMLFIVDTIVSMIVLGLCIFAGCRLWAVGSGAVGMAKAYLVTGLVYRIVFFVLYFTAAGLPTFVKKAILPSVLRDQLIGMAILVAWLVYLCVSKRVAITYARKPQERGPW